MHFRFNENAKSLDREVGVREIGGMIEKSEKSSNPSHFVGDLATIFFKVRVISPFRRSLELWLKSGTSGVGVWSVLSRSLERLESGSNYCFFREEGELERRRGDENEPYFILKKCG